MTIVERRKRPSAIAAKVLPPTPPQPPSPTNGPKRLFGSALREMEEPQDEDVFRAMVSLAWVCRSNAADIDRLIMERSPAAAAANPNLKGTADTLSGIGQSLSALGYEREADACAAAAAAAMAAFFTGKVAIFSEQRLMAASASSDAQWSLYEKLSHKATVAWGQSAERAKDEAHRALASLCDRFPDCFDKISEDER
jgi:hypothetical protein